MADLIERLKDGETYTDAVDEAIDEIERLRSVVRANEVIFSRFFRLLQCLVDYFIIQNINNSIVSEAERLLTMLVKRSINNEQNKSN